MSRVENLRKIMKENNCDAFVITSFHNLYYLAHHTSDEAILFITNEDCFIISDFRYRTQIAQECYKEFKYIETKNKNMVEAVKSCLNENIKNIGFEGDYITFSFYDSLKTLEGINYVNVDLKAFHAIKDQEEIECIKKASEIAEEAFKYIVDNVVKVGVSELEIANKLEYKMKELGAIKPSFDSIVASGTNGALPHAKPSEKQLADGDMVTIDFGAYYKYYCSDITRTFAVGNFKNKELEKIYNIVKDAQKLAISKIKAGVKCSDIDKAARDYIASFGYGENFGHGLGHCVGIQIHEYPNFNPVCDCILEEGMVITVEPGIYVEGLGGVRIEDDVIITKDGCEVIQKLDRELKILK